MTEPNRQNNCVVLFEEVPGVTEYRWVMWEHRPGGTGRGRLWLGMTKEEGDAWAVENGVTVDFVEFFEP